MEYGLYDIETKPSNAKNIKKEIQPNKKRIPEVLIQKGIEKSVHIPSEIFSNTNKKAENITLNALKHTTRTIYKHVGQNSDHHRDT